MLPLLRAPLLLILRSLMKELPSFPACFGLETWHKALEAKGRGGVATFKSDFSTHPNWPPTPQRTTLRLRKFELWRRKPASSTRSRVKKEKAGKEGGGEIKFHIPDIF